MLSNIINRSTAAFGGAPFRLNKCTALGSAGAGAAGGAAVAGAFPGCSGIRARMHRHLPSACDQPHRGRQALLSLSAHSL